jgi:hypothetical protein
MPARSDRMSPTMVGHDNNHAQHHTVLASDATTGSAD